MLVTALDVVGDGFAVSLPVDGLNFFGRMFFGTDLPGFSAANVEAKEWLLDAVGWAEVAEKNQVGLDGAGEGVADPVAVFVQVLGRAAVGGDGEDARFGFGLEIFGDAHARAKKIDREAIGEVFEERCAD